MKLLLIGRGAREHCLAWKLAESDNVEQIFVVPGNGGTDDARNKKISSIRSVDSHDFAALVALAKDLRIDLVVVGPDSAVVGGIEEQFRLSNIPCFSQSKEAAVIEGSKTAAKTLMQKYNIPTADYQSFHQYDEACRYLSTMTNQRVVIKVDGLADGKGVILPQDAGEARQALREIFIDVKFGKAGSTVIIEEYLDGDEISLLTFSDGKTHKSLPPGQDHKRIFSGNLGPNTGGMGVYAPLDFVTPRQMDEIDQTIVQPTLNALKSEGRPFRGLLFTGIIMTAKGPKVLEYNARFGDPETQSMLLLLSPDCDLSSILLACCTESLHSVPISILPGYACNVVIASNGYPGNYTIGETIEFSTCPEGVHIFHAGTERKNNGEIVTAGGRVLSVAAYGPTLEEAVSLAYKGVASIRFKGKIFRDDIASRYADNVAPSVCELTEVVCWYMEFRDRVASLLSHED